jgi:hypothetical protein
MAQKFLPSCRKGLDYEVSVKWKKGLILPFIFPHALVSAPVAIGAFFIFEDV